MSAEEWRQVVGWEGSYEVSSFGRVKSLRGTKPRIITGSTSGQGYKVVKLRAFEEKRDIGVHRLVLEAFVGPAPGPEYEGCHNDGSTDNNALSNLRWDTPTGNSADRRLHGTLASRNFLTEDQVVRIRTEPDVHDLTWASMFGVHRNVVRHARTGFTWGWLTTPPLKRPVDRRYTLELTLRGKMDIALKSPLEIYRHHHGHLMHAEVTTAIERMQTMVDALLNHCDKEGGECSVCGTIVCPHKDSMHFHHDGCPSCSQHTSRSEHE